MQQQHPLTPLLEPGHTQQQETQDVNEHYFSYFQYVLCILGYSVGYGSFWRFPYLIYENGGGVFLIPYVLAMTFFGVPLLYLETCLGQMYQLPITRVMRSISQSLKHIGFICIVISLAVSSYYNLLLAYSYRFVFAAFVNPLPFASQSPVDNTYFNEQLLQKSASINQYGSINVPLMLCYLLSLFICYYCISRGVKVGARIVFFTVLLPYLFIGVLAVRGLSLEGSELGIQYLFEPDWSKLLRPKIWVEAMVQVFYQLSIGSGGMVYYASKKPKTEKFLSILYIVPLGLLICGILSGLIVFMYVGHFCHMNGLSITELPLSGLDLAFNVFPKAISVLPWPNLWFLIFCAVLVLLGIDSMFGFLELQANILAVECGETGIGVLFWKITQSNAKKLVIGVTSIASLFYCSSAGIYYLQYVDRFIPGVGLSFGALIEVYVCAHLCNFNQLSTEVEKHTGQATPEFVRAILTSRGLLIGLASIVGLGIYQLATLQAEYSTRLFVVGWLLSLSYIVFALAYWRFKANGEYLLCTPSLQEEQELKERPPNQTE